MTVRTDDELVLAWEGVVGAVAGVQRRVLDEVVEPGLTSVEFTALHLLLRADGHRLPMTRLARELQMSSGGFTKVADRLGKEGLIDRRNSSADRRMIYVALTDKGADVVGRAAKRYMAAVREKVVDVVGASGLQSLAAAVAKLVEDEIEVVG